MTTDRPRLKGLSFPCIAAALALLVAPALFPVSGGWQTATRWEDGTGELTIESSKTAGGKWTYELSVPRNSEVRTATMKVRGEPYIMDPGRENQTYHWPQDPSIDITGDGSVDWAFNGTMGLQRAFADNTTEMDLRWESPGLSRYIDIPMPKSTVNSFSLAVSNTQTSAYDYSMAIGQEPVWARESRGFTHNQTVLTGKMVDYMTTADVNGDGLADLIGCSGNGTVFVARNQNGRFGNANIIDCQVPSGRSINMIAAGDLDGSPGVDLAGAGGDGNIYYLLNQGGAGLFGGAAVITSGATYMYSLVIADVDGDGWNDIVAGSRDGKFYLFFNEGNAQFDTSGGPGSASFKVLDAGSSRMNAVAVADINQDTFPDLVGANSNRQFYVVPSLGGRDFDNVYPVVTGAIRDLVSVDAVDVDKDGDPDLLGASMDAKVYLCYNLGNAQGGKAGDFNTQPGHIVKISCESDTTLALGGSVVQDFDADGWPDILAVDNSNTGQVFIIFNDGFGNYTNTNIEKPFSVGHSTYGFTAASLGRNGYVDIVVADLNQLDIWKSNQGPFDEVLGGPAFVQAAQAFIDNATAVPDRYVNPWVTLRLSITNAHTGQLHFSGLAVKYNYSAPVNFTSQLSAHLNATADQQNQTAVKVPVVFSMGSAGILRVSDLNIETQLQFAAIIRSPANGSTLYRGQPFTLSGGSNYDPDGTLYNYSWTDLAAGRLLGFGSTIQFTPAVNGPMTLQLRARNDLSGKEALATSRITVTDQPVAALSVVSVSLKPQNPTEGQLVTMTVTLKNSGKLNATGIGFVVLQDNEKGVPVASGIIGRIDAGGSATGSLCWTAGAPGSHRLFVVITQSDVPFTTEARPYTSAVDVRRPQQAYPVELIAYGTFAGLGAAAAVVFFVATEVGTFLGFSLLLPLYTKLRPEEVLDGFTRGKILGYIRANPGAHYNLIKQDLDMPNGTLIHHLDTLERNGFIRSARDGLLKRFFPGNGKVPEGKFYLSPIQDSIAKYIGANPGVSQADLSRGLYIEPHIVKYHIKVLRDASLLRVEEDGNRTRLFLR